MVFDSTADYRSQRLLKKYIRAETSPATQIALKGLLHCGDAALPILAQPAAFIVRYSQEGDENAKTTSAVRGVITCNSIWSCPVCAVHEMARRGARIAAAIDALSSLYKQSAAMFTFTIPHRKSQPLYEVFDILQATWRRFIKSSKSSKKRKYTRKDTGENVTYEIQNSEFCRLRSSHDNIYSVRVYEVTYGKAYGWHPHIHALYWFPNEKFNSITEREELIAKYWQSCARAEYLKYYRARKDTMFNGDDAAVVKFVDSVFRPSEIEKHFGFYISKNPDGTPRKVTSSAYLSGWSGDAELTKVTAKKARTGHYSVFQLLDEAKAAKTWDDAKPWLALFTEYAYATRGHRRINWSRPNPNKIIDAWIKKHGDPLITKKKDTRPIKKTVVYWFSADEWYSVVHFDRICGEDIDLVSLILERARLPNASEQIDQLLLSLGLCGMMKWYPHPEQSRYEYAA